MNNEPQIIAILQAIEMQLTDPDGRVQQSQNDALKTYGLVAQIAELIGIQRDQISALADTMTVFLSKLIELDRRVAGQHADMLFVMHAMADSLGMEHAAEQAAQARAVVEAAAEQRLREIAISADEARQLLSRAKLDAQRDIKRAVAVAQDEIAQAAETARTVLYDEAESQ